TPKAWPRATPSRPRRTPSSPSTVAAPKRRKQREKPSARPLGMSEPSAAAVGRGNVPAGTGASACARRNAQASVALRDQGKGTCLAEASNAAQRELRKKLAECAHVG